MAETQTVVIEFITNDEQLDSAINKLEKTGAVDTALATAFKQTTSEITKQAAEMKKVGAATVPIKKNLEDVNKATKQFTQDFMTGFNEGVIETLKEAGVTAEQFSEALKTGGTEISESTDTVKSRLRGITEQLAILKARGEDNTEQYRMLTVEAGNLRDALSDVGDEINRAGSDTRVFDSLINVAQGVTGGFAIAQGAAALFGDESEELQQTLLKVNAAMAILQGLQQVQEVISKRVAIARGLDAAATGFQTAAQKLYNIVVGESIGLMAAFRVALASTGVGLLILGIIALVSALDKEDKQLKKVNEELDRNKKLIEADRAAIEDLAEKELARAEAVGAKESELIAIRGRGLLQQRKSIKEANTQLIEQRDTLDKTSEGYFILNKAIEDNNELIKGIDNKLIIEQINLDKQRKEEALQAVADRLDAELQGATKNSAKELEIAKQLARAKAAVELNSAGDNLEKRLLIEKALQKQMRDLDRSFAQVQQQDKIDAAERELLSVQQKSKAINERTSQDEINAQKKLLLEKTRLDLLQEGLTANGRELIWENYFAAVKELQKGFNNQSTRETLEDLISRNNAELTQVNISNKEKLALQEENLIAQAQIEIDTNKGLTDKIKEIRAKLNEDLRALRLAAIEKDLQDELDATQVRTGVLRRVNERIAADERKPLDARLKAINQLAALEIAAINKRQDALDKELQDKLISQEDYKNKYAKLVDDETKILEDAEKKKTELIKAENIERINIATQVLGQIADIVAGINETQAQRENDRLSAERERVAELLEAGAITEREATARNKRLDQEEKKIKAQQAQREKNLAVFRALLAIPQAILQGLAQGGPVLAAIYGALAAAQAVIIASRPLPRFGHGKKSGYQGPAEIGETGPELYEQNGRMFLADKKQIVWLAAQDKVYNPTETKEMLMPVVDREVMNWRPPVQKQHEIDYDKLGKALGKHINIPGFNIDEQGFKIWQQQGLSRQNYMDKRYSSK